MKNKFEMKLKGTTLTTQESVASLIKSMTNKGVAYDIETRPGRFRIARVDVLDTGSRYKERDLIMYDTNAHFIQSLEDDGKFNAETLYHQQHYRLYYVMNFLQGYEQVKNIEETISENIKNNYKFIDAHGGKVEGVIQHSKDFIIEGEIKEHYKNRDLLDIRKFKKEDNDFKGFVTESMLTVQYLNLKGKNEDLVEMAAWLNKKGVTPETDRLFNAIAYGLFNDRDKLKEKNIVKILNLIGGDGNYDKYKEGKTVKRRSSMGTFIGWASKNGFKRSYLSRYFVKEKNVREYETISFKGHVQKEEMYKLITNDNRTILVDSPTGSGKSTAAWDGAEMWLKEDPKNRHLLFLLPTTSLTDQIAYSNGLSTGLKGRLKAAKVRAKNLKDSKGLNVMAATYDKAPRYIEEIEMIKGVELLIIVDEAHKEVSDYFFRRRAIKGVGDAKDHPLTVKFIGLSGTTQEIDKEGYDQLVKFEPEDKMTVFKEFLALRYSSTKDYEVNTGKIIDKEISEGQQVLAFINNVETIEDVAKNLEKMGRKVLKVYSGNTDKIEVEAYEKMLKEEKFPEEYDAVLATSFIADGINIKNETDKFTVVIAPSAKKSPIFNLSQIKQMSNRLRGRYKRIIVSIFVKENIEEERKNQVELFGLEARFEELLEIAEAIAENMRNKFSDRFDQYMPGSLEVAAGLPHINSHYQHKDSITVKDWAKALKRYRHIKDINREDLKHEDIKLIEEVKHVIEFLFKVDRRTLRKTASMDQELYYQNFPFAFIAGLEWILEIEATRVYLNDYLSGYKEERARLIEELTAERAEEKELTEEEKRANLESIYTEEVHNEIVSDYVKHGKRTLTDGSLWKMLQKELASIDLKTIENQLSVLDYKEMVKVVKRTKSTSHQGLLMSRLEAYDEVQAYQNATTKSDTNIVFDLLVKVAKDESLYLTDAKGRKLLPNTALKTELAHLSATTKRTVNSLLRDFDKYFSYDSPKSAVTIKGNSYRGKYNVEVISLEGIAREFELDVKAIQKAYDKFVYDRYDKDTMDEANRIARRL